MALLCCDLDDTLIDRHRIFSAWAADYARSHGRGKDFVEWLICEDDGGYRPREDLWTAVKDALSLDEPIGELISAYRRSFVGYVRSAEPVTDALSKARDSGWAIAVVTNGDDIQVEKLNAAGLAPLVDAVCVSGLEGFRKPHPRIFELAALRCGTELAGAWMIGDNPETDVGGAAACGIESAWLSRGRAWPSNLPFHPTLIAESFPEAAAKIVGEGQISRI